MTQPLIYLDKDGYIPPIQDKPTHGRFKDASGQQFGELEALYFLAMRERIQPGRIAYYWCRCSCGVEKAIAAIHLRAGKAASCGKGIHATGYKHGTTGRNKKAIPEYGIWAAMRDRCNNPNNKHFKDYGGRGITVCQRWNDFRTFLADMGPRPSPRHTLDREDNDKGYSPDNCRWATRKQQARNTRLTRMVTVDGETVPLNDVADAVGIHEKTLKGRLAKGLTLGEALEIPIDGQRQRSHNPKTGRFTSLDEMRKASHE
jgi:hypothetical protein